MSIEFDLTQYNDVMNNMRNITNIYPTKATKFMQTQGTALKKVVTTTANQKTKKKTGYYLRSIKRGKAFKYTGDKFAIRVFTTAPHGHLIEQPHKTPNGGKTQGKWVFYLSQKKYESTFVSNCADFVDEIIKEL